jgi:uncharacterized membrane protein (DUF4010 family)
MPPFPSEPLLGLSVALGVGLLIGLDRERRKGEGTDRRAAGIRSFAVAALGGALAQTLGQPALVAAGAAVTGGLAALAYWRSRAGDDPGLTTELALFVTYLLGVMAMQQPALAAGAGVVTAVLLAARDPLHHFATRLLTEAELHDALLLAALLLVVLPLTPSDPVPWLAGLVPRTLALLAVLILLLQGAGHVAGRLAGPRAGLVLAGLLSGFVSSTATVASLGARARTRPDQAAACEAGAMMSTAATWVLALTLLGAVAPALAWHLLPASLTGAAVASVTGLWRARHAVPGAPEPERGTRGPLRLREALLVAAVLGAVALAVGHAQRQFGDTGVLAGTALSSLVDAHAAVATLGTLQQAARIEIDLATGGVLLAIGTNSLSRIVAALIAGGAGYASRVAASLALSGAAAAAVAFTFSG